MVAPQHLVTVAAPVDGNVEAVYAHEGQRVAAGDVLGALNDWQWRTDLAAAEAKYQQAELVMENDLARGSAQAGADRAQAEYLRSEVARARARLDSAQLRSPIAGIVVTPNLQNAAGKHLDAGATFAQVLDLNSAVVQIAVPERDAALLHSGEPAAIKLDSYPQRTWRNAVSVVGPEAQAGEGERTFTAEVPVAKRRRNSPRRNDGPGKNFYRLAAGWICPAARARALDMADSVELDWLVTHMNPHSSSRDLLLPLPCWLLSRSCWLLLRLQLASPERRRCCR